MHQTFNPLQVALVDHCHHIRVARHTGVEFAICTAQRIQQPFELLPRHVDHVRVDADLPAIAGLARSKAEGGLVQVRRARNDHRRLAAELQGHRHQVFRRIAHHPSTNRRAAREHQMIKGLAAEGFAQFRPAVEHRYDQWVQVIGAEPGQQFSSTRQHF